MLKNGGILCQMLVSWACSCGRETFTGQQLAAAVAVTLGIALIVVSNAAAPLGNLRSPSSIGLAVARHTAPLHPHPFI